jgi:hypothetical protein
MQLLKATTNKIDKTIKIKRTPIILDVVLLSKKSNRLGNKNLDQVNLSRN